MKDQTYSRRFSSPRSMESFMSRLSLGRVKKTYDYQDVKTGNTVYVVVYYRDTKANRKKFNFTKQEIHGEDEPVHGIDVEEQGP